jgi:hypothetical protein
MEFENTLKNLDEIGAKAPKCIRHCHTSPLVVIELV